ncbi:MAG: histidinol dehydrogenase [Natronomonas sp.]|nr:histidinol dehydrogenase [Natronomonas sp.]
MYCIGGAQAIGAMAYDTETVPDVDLLEGPGNVFVTEAKRRVFGHVRVDFIAGPTEVLIVADDTADSDMVATYLLAYAEHEPNSRAVLIALSRDLAAATTGEIGAQSPTIETEETARKSCADNGELVVEEKSEAINLTNDYAMEHVQIMIDDARSYVHDLHNSGSLFLGHHAPLIFGDKAVGTNHCLPTLGVALYFSGIWVGTYLKTPTYQELTLEGAARIVPRAAAIFDIEGTHAHQIVAEKGSCSTWTSNGPAAADGHPDTEN